MTIITRTMIKSIIVNSFLSIIKIIAGIFGKSAALIADGIHSLSDLTTDIVAIWSDHYVSKHGEDENHPYGHGQLQYVVAFVVGIAMLYIAFVLLRSAFQVEPMIPNALVIIVVVVTMISKWFLARYVYQKGVEHKVNLLIACGQESKADVYSSIVILFSVIAAQFNHAFPVLKYADKFAVVVVALFITYTAFGIIKENLSAILNEQDYKTGYELQFEKIIKLIYKDVIIDDIILIKFGFYYKLTINLTLTEDLTIKEIAKNNDLIKTKIKDNYPIKYININVDYKEKK